MPFWYLVGFFLNKYRDIMQAKSPAKQYLLLSIVLAKSIMAQKAQHEHSYLYEHWLLFPEGITGEKILTHKIHLDV